MSRIGKLPVALPAGVTATVDGQTVRVKGPKGELNRVLPEGISAKVGGGKVELDRAADERRFRSLHGLSRTLVANMVEGVTTGYSKDLELQGVGFKAAVQGQKLVLTLGFAGPVEFTVPAGVKVSAEGGTAIKVSGPDKELVGIVSARIRSFYPAEPYKGKGLRYKGEYVRRKVGKTVA
jgi:large subunit ribosomal protein L6